MRSNSRPLAFTLVELLITMSLMGVVGSIIYALATESLVSFGRNVSINKSYTDARSGLDRIGLAVQCAGQTPALVGPDGKTTDSGGATITSPAAGIAFYRYGASPTYSLPSGGPTLTSNTLTLTGTPDQPAPKVGDIVLIGGIGFQGTVTAVSGTSSPYTLTFGGTIASYCLPANPTAATATTCLSALVFNQVAFITVNRQLRYYPDFPAAMANSAAGFNLPANYKVIAALPTNPTTLLASATGLPVNATAENAAQAGKPFSVGQGATVLVTLCAEAPDYVSRNNYAGNASSTGASAVNGGTINTVGSFGSFTQMQAAYGARCSGLLR